MPDIYLHVGFPKTGTTFLQDICFPHLKSVHVIRQGHRAPPTGLIDRLWRIADAYPLFVDMDEQRAEVDRFLHSVTDGKVLISSERLIGDIVRGFHDHVQVTESLRHLFPSARILLTIRRQDEFLESLYRQFVRGYYYPSVDGFLAYQDRKFDNWYRPPPVFPSINVWRLDYHAYAQNYAEAFGQQNVAVLPHEMLQSEPRRFHDALAEFIGTEPYYPPNEIDLNRSYSLLACRIALLLNRFVRDPLWERQPWRIIPHQPLTPYLYRRDRHDLIYRLLDSINRRLSLRYVLENVVDRLYYQHGNLISEEKRRLILDIHRESNHKLEEEYGINLQQYGYY